MIVLRVVYRTMFTPRALFSVCFTEQCLLLKLCSHDCSLCGLQNNAYYWSFGLMIVLWFTEQWLLLGLHSFCGLLHQPPPVHTTRLVACLPLSSFPAVFYCFSLSFIVSLFLLLFFLFLLLFVALIGSYHQIVTPILKGQKNSQVAKLGIEKELTSML